MGCLFAHIHAISSALLMSGLGGITVLGEDCVMEADDRGSDLGHNSASPPPSLSTPTVYHYYHRCGCTMMRCRSAEKNAIRGHHHFHFIPRLLVGLARDAYFAGIGIPTF
jgi:hypothetical protein